MRANNTKTRLLIEIVRTNEAKNDRLPQSI